MHRMNIFYSDMVRQATREVTFMATQYRRLLHYQTYALQHI